jgi:predicted secreted protein
MTQPAAPRSQITLSAVAGAALLALRESPTTGYRWRLTNLPAELEIVSDQFVPAPGGLGAGGERTFTLQCRTTGTFRFSAELARAGEPPDQSVAVTVITQ